LARLRPCLLRHLNWLLVFKGLRWLSNTKEIRYRSEIEFSGIPFVQVDCDFFAVPL